MKQVLRQVSWFLLLFLLLAACGGSSTSPAAVEEAAPETAVDQEAAPVAGKPQFIDFYASW